MFVAIALGLSAILLLHFFEPGLSITWSYAHLHRTAWLPWLAAGVSVALPLAAHRLAQLDPARAPLERRSPLWFAAAGVLLFGGLVWIGRQAPAPHLTIDQGIFVGTVLHGHEVARWHLLLALHQNAVELLRDFYPRIGIIRAINALMASIALVSLVGCARCLARNRIEAVSIALLAWTAFGIAQLSIGYTDFYPLPLGFTALYAWLALASIQRRCHPAFPLAVAALGPFFYLGLVILAPSAVALLVVEWRRERRIHRFVLGSVIALGLAGAATLPGYGAPFAFFEHLDAVFVTGTPSLGYNPDGYHLPWERIVRLDHAENIAHLMLLVDPVGWLFTLLCGGWLARHWKTVEQRAEVLFLGLLGLTYGLFLLTMDPVMGAFGDWDLYSYGAVGSALLGATSFVIWSRRAPKALGLLLGLALAVSSVHLMARLHAMDVEKWRHKQESPDHRFAR